MSILPQCVLVPWTDSSTTIFKNTTTSSLAKLHCSPCHCKPYLWSFTSVTTAPACRFTPTLASLAGCCCGSRSVSNACKAVARSSAACRTQTFARVATSHAAAHKTARVFQQQLLPAVQHASDQQSKQSRTWSLFGITASAASAGVLVPVAGSCF